MVTKYVIKVLNGIDSLVQSEYNTLKMYYVYLNHILYTIIKKYLF